MTRYPLQVALVLSVMLCAGSTVSRADDEPEQAWAASNKAADLASHGLADTDSAADPRRANQGSEIVLPPPSDAGDRVTPQPGPQTVGAGIVALQAETAPDETAAPSTTAASFRRDPVPWYRHGAISLGLVLAVIAGIALLLRRLVPAVRTMNGSAIEVLGRNHLSPKQSLALVRVGRRVLLIGVTAERLNTLCEVDDAEEVADLLVRAPSGRRSDQPAGFDKMLNEAAGGLVERTSDAGELLHGPSERLIQAKGQLQGLLGKLKALKEQGN